MVQKTLCCINDKINDLSDLVTSKNLIWLDDFDTLEDCKQLTSYN